MYDEQDALQALLQLSAYELYVIVGCFWGHCTDVQLAEELSELRGERYGVRRVNRIRHRALATMKAHVVEMERV